VRAGNTFEGHLEHARRRWRRARGMNHADALDSGVDIGGVVADLVEPEPAFGALHDDFAGDAEAPARIDPRRRHPGQRQILVEHRRITLAAADPARLALEAHPPGWRGWGERRGWLVDDVPLDDAARLGTRHLRIQPVRHAVDAEDEIWSGGQARTGEVVGEVLELGVAVGRDPGHHWLRSILGQVRASGGVASRALALDDQPALLGILDVGTELAADAQQRLRSARSEAVSLRFWKDVLKSAPMLCGARAASLGLTVSGTVPQK